MEKQSCLTEHDFALVIDGVPELTTEVENALFEAGCDDATFGIQYGHLYAEFSRMAPSFQGAILSAIQDIRKANIGADVVQVDACDIVSQAEIARRIGRSRQLVFQYVTGDRGPGNFPPPVCNLGDGSPLWQWCAVSYWLAQNNLIRKEEVWNAEVVSGINNWLDMARRQKRNPNLVKEIDKAMHAV